MKRWIVGLVVVVAMAVAQSGFAAITFDDGGVHSISTSVTGPVVVSDGGQGPTSLNVLSGAIVLGENALGNAGTYGIWSGTGGIVNMSGGAVFGGNASGGNAHAFGIFCENGGIANISGGIVSGGDAGGNASGNAHTYGIGVFGGMVNMSGGVVLGGNALSSSFNAHAYGILNNGGTVNISGGTVSVGSYYESANGNVYGIFNNGGTVNISGGMMTYGGASNNTHTYGIYNNGGVVNIYGRDFNYPDGPISVVSGTLTGTLANGDPITWTFYQNSGKVVLNSPHGGAVPEPSSLVMFAGLGAMGLIGASRRRKRQSA